MHELIRARTEPCKLGGTALLTALALSLAVLACDDLVPFEVYYPRIESITPERYVLTVTDSFTVRGRNFTAHDVVVIDGTGTDTRFVSSTELRVRVRTQPTPPTAEVYIQRLRPDIIVSDTLIYPVDLPH